MQVIYPSYRPSPLEGFGEGMQTLADAVIKSRERQALNQDADLIGQAIARAQGGGQDPTAWQRDPGAEVPSGDVPEPGQGGGQDPTAWQSDPGAEVPSGDVPEPTLGSGGPLVDAFKEILPQMRTPQGRFQVVKMMMQHAPQDVYGYEGGKFVRKGSIPKDAQILKPDPAEAEARKFERQQALEEKKQEGRESLQAQKEEWRTNLEDKRQEARDARDFRRYRYLGDMLTKRLDFQERMKDKTSQKDRTEYARRELVNARQQAMKNYNARTANVRKEFTDPMTKQIEDPKALEGALGGAKQEYDEHLQLINDSYADVIEKYGIKAPGGAQAGKAAPQVLSQKFEEARGRVEAMPEGPAKEGARQKLAAWQAKYLGK